MPRFLAYLIILVNTVGFAGAVGLFFMIEEVQRYEASRLAIQPMVWYSVTALPLGFVVALFFRRWFKAMVIIGLPILIFGGVCLYLSFKVYVDDSIQAQTVVTNHWGLPDTDDYGEVEYEENPAYTVYQERLQATRLLSIGFAVTGLALLAMGPFGRSLDSPIESIPKDYRLDHGAK